MDMAKYLDKAGSGGDEKISQKAEVRKLKMAEARTEKQESRR